MTQINSVQCSSVMLTGSIATFNMGRIRKSCLWSTFFFFSSSWGLLTCAQLRACLWISCGLNQSIATIRRTSRNLEQQQGVVIGSFFFFFKFSRFELANCQSYVSRWGNTNDPECANESCILDVRRNMNNEVDLCTLFCVIRSAPSQPEFILADLTRNGMPNPKSHDRTKYQHSFASSERDDCDQPLQLVEFLFSPPHSFPFFQPHFSTPGRAKLGQSTKVLQKQ